MRRTDACARYQRYRFLSGGGLSGEGRIRKCLLTAVNEMKKKNSAEFDYRFDINVFLPY